MKKKYILSLALCLTLGMTSYGQTAYMSEIKVEGRQISKTADRKVKIDVDLDFSGLDLKRQHSLRIVPVLVSADGSQKMELSSVVVNGGVRQKVLDRTESLEKIAVYTDVQSTIRRKNGTRQSCHYTTSVPFKRWMIDGELQFYGYVSGCAGCDGGNEDGHETMMTGNVLPQVSNAYIAPFIQSQEEIVKRRSETRSARLQFRQGSDNIDPKFKDNAKELDDVRHSIGMVRNNNDLVVTGVYVTGYASPEGQFDMNMALSERRAKAFTEYVKDDIKSIKSELYHVDWKGEDWEGLRKEVMKYPGLLKREEVLHIIDNCGNDKDACEEQLKTLVPPEVYERLLNEMYGPLRRNEYRIEYNVRHFNLEEAKQQIKTRPDLLSVSEIQKVADSFGKGTNGYADALVQGVKGHSTDVTALNNAALALIETGRSKDAVALLEKAPEDGILLNMLGAAYQKSGRTNDALKAYERSASKGCKEGKQNLDTLKRYIEYNAE